MEPKSDDNGFARWAADVNAYCMAEYRITPEDGGYDMDDYLRGYDCGDTPEDYVEWYARKYALEKIQLNLF